MSTDVRLRFSGIVIFAARIFSILTGLVFGIIVARSFSIPEMGVWQNIVSVMTIMTLGAAIIPFWSARYTARRYGGALKAGLVGNLIIAVGATLLAILLGVFVFAPFLRASASLYLYASILVVEGYVIGAMDPVVGVWRTHAIAFAIVCFETIKVSTVYLFLALFHIGIYGALTALILANLGWIVVYAIILRNLWFEKTNLSYLRQWINGSFLNAYIVGANLLTTLEGIIIVFRGGSDALANYGVSMSIATPISFTAALSTALYPRILVGGSGEDVEAAWKITLLFSIPLTLSFVALASSLLSIYNDPYAPAYFVLSVLALRYFVGSFNPIFDAIVHGTERLDEKGTISPRAAIRSRLFLPPTVVYVAYVVYLPLLWSVLQFFNSTPLLVAEAAALFGLPVNIAVTTAKYLIARRYMTFRFPIGSAVKFTLVGGGLSVVIPLLYVMGLVTLPLQTLPTIGLFALGGLVYFLVLYFIEEEARELVDAILARLGFVLRGIPFAARVLGS